MPALISIAVFAHNEARTLARTMESIYAAGEGCEYVIAILANGCSDRTVELAQDLASRQKNVFVKEIDRADKANAWNYYVHELSDQCPFHTAHLHVFVDGDVKILPTSFDAFLASANGIPSVNALGALPATGRNRQTWSHQMIATQTLAGGLYALTSGFLERIRERRVHIPCGFIGEDWAVSLFAKFDLQPILDANNATRHIVFPPNAGFSFDSLSYLQAQDYKIWLRRLWRYSLRGVQFEMLFNWLLHRCPEELPETVEQLYQLGNLPSRLKWVGPTSILRSLAVQKARNSRTALPRNTKHETS